MSPADLSCKRRRWRRRRRRLSWAHDDAADGSVGVAARRTFNGRQRVIALQRDAPFLRSAESLFHRSASSAPLLTCALAEDGPAERLDPVLGAVCGPSLVYGYPGVAVEVTRFGGLATVTLFSM